MIKVDEVHNYLMFFFYKSGGHSCPKYDSMELNYWKDFGMSIPIRLIPTSFEKTFKIFPPGN